MLRSVFTMICLLTFSALCAQTADEIVTKHTVAIGGMEVIGKIKSQVTHADLSVMGSTLTSISTLLVGKGFKNVADFNGQEIIQCITPSGGWMINPLAGSADPQPLPEDQVKAAQSALDIGSELVNYKTKGSKLELAGREQVEGVNSYKIKLTSKDGTTSYYFIDPASYYVIKRESTANVGGQDVTAVSTFSNHKKTDIGLVIPYTTVTNQGFEITVNINKVEFNKEIDPKIFEMPK